MPNLTLEDALKEFPEECNVLFRELDKEPYRGMYEKNLPGDLAWAALRWLAGKDFSPLGVLVDEAAEDGSVQWLWPTDPLRWLLEEVREQRKQENAT